jgi:hypothetical protein
MDAGMNKRRCLKSSAGVLAVWPISLGSEGSADLQVRPGR